MLVLRGVRKSVFFSFIPSNSDSMTDGLWGIDKSFICNDCDAKRLPLPDKSESAHNYDAHTLVRCQELVKDVEVSVEEQLASLEAKFVKHETTINDRLMKLESRIDDRLAAVEKMLEVMHQKLGVDVEAS